MQFLQGKSATEFGHTLGTPLTGAKQVVVAGDAPPRDLDMLDERVRSRLLVGAGGPRSTGVRPRSERRTSSIVAAAQAPVRASASHFPPAVLDYIVAYRRSATGAISTARSTASLRPTS